ncbi:MULTISPECIES: DUF7504 family protein [unclassified Haloparvum]|uniref:DUF7504 family protein n=1 Tax=Haloparvum sp. PAK95 TaxID=3418962 RepID=UPI003D2EFA7C
MSILPASVLEAESVLLVGPPMSGKYDLFHRILGEWTTEPIVISTGQTAEKVRNDHEELTDADGENAIVVDCASREQGETVEDTPRTKYVDSAGDLTDIGVKFTNVVEDLADEEDHAVGLFSISELLMYWDPERIYQFIRVLSSQATGQDWPFVSAVGSTAHEEATLHTLYEPFDRVVETRVDDEREFRVRDRVGSPTDWQSF